jgi:hypothetical protein
VSTEVLYEVDCEPDAREIARRGCLDLVIQAIEVTIKVTSLADRTPQARHTVSEYLNRLATFFTSAAIDGLSRPFEQRPLQIRLLGLQSCCKAHCCRLEPLGFLPQGVSMNDHTSLIAMQNRAISIIEAHEIRHWKKVFDCTSLELREAVAAVGNVGAEIGAYIELHRPLPLPHLSDTLRVASRSELSSIQP